MKYVYIDRNHIDDDWLAKAEALRDEAMAIVDAKERSKFIAKRSKQWGDLKPKLEQISDGKCWYTEARDKVSHWQVDHFRPKSIYPWLAFDWTNFRLIGGKPNVKKSNHFELSDGSVRATPDNPDVTNESPLLLDPAMPNDVELLTFSANGEPAPLLPNDEAVVKRVDCSVQTYELASALLCEARREKWRACRDKLKKWQTIVEAQRQGRNPEGADFSRELVNDIANLYDPRAEFTRVAYACAQSLGVENLVQSARDLAAALNAQQQAQ